MKCAPTLWLEKGTEVNIKKELLRLGWQKAFLKPIFGQGARECLRFEANEAGFKAAQAHCDRLLPSEGLIMQPYLKLVEQIGEFSGIFFNY